MITVFDGYRNLSLDLDFDVTTEVMYVLYLKRLKHIIAEYVQY